MKTQNINNWEDKVVFGDQGPQPQELISDGILKSVIVGLNEGQIIPNHPAPTAVYHILQGSGKMTIEEETIDVETGNTIVVPNGFTRGFEAKTKMVLLGTHGKTKDN